MSELTMVEHTIYPNIIPVTMNLLFSSGCWKCLLLQGGAGTVTNQRQGQEKEVITCTKPTTDFEL